MNHAVGALFISTGPILLPLRQLHQLLKGFCIPLLEQIAGLLPSEDVVRWIPPRRTLVLTPPHKKIQKQRGLVELPTWLGASKDLGEKLLSPLPLQEMLLIRSFLIAIPWGDRHPFDAKRHHFIEKRSDPFGIRIIE